MTTIKDSFEKAFAEVKTENEKFFNYFGIRGEDLEACKAEAEEFIKDFAAAGMGRGFFDSPLGRKAFIVGYFRGRAAGEWPRNDSAVQYGVHRGAGTPGGGATMPGRDLESRGGSSVPEWQR